MRVEFQVLEDFFEAESFPWMLLEKLLQPFGHLLFSEAFAPFLSFSPIRLVVYGVL